MTVPVLQQLLLSFTIDIFLVKTHQETDTTQCWARKSNIYQQRNIYGGEGWGEVGRGVKVREDTLQLEFKLASQRSAFKRGVSVRTQDKKEKVLWIF